MSNLTKVNFKEKSVIKKSWIERIFGCFHDYKLIYDSENSKDEMRNLGIPIRCSIGGIEQYKCMKCGKTYYEKWSAF